MRRDSRRLWPLDALRGAAVIVMVETHVFNAAADPGLRGADFTGLWNGFHGLVAPLFFMLTGYALELRPPTTRPALDRRVRTIALWWVLAMLLHLPNRNPAGAFPDLSPLLQFDVLHALALTAFVLTAVQLAANRRALPYLFLTGLALTGAILADRSPWVCALHPWWRGLLAHTAYSRFPLLPWSAFGFLGAWLGSLERRRYHFASTSAAGWPAVAMLCCILAFLAGGTSWGRQLTADGRASPFFALERAGATMALMLAALGLQDRAPGRIASALAYFGRRSLGVYFVHLFLFFSDVRPGGSWASQVAARFSVEGIAGTTVLLLGSSLAVCWCAETGLAVIRAQNPLGEWAS